MISKDDFINSNYDIAIGGVYIGSDAVHVGIAWKDEGEKKIIHFIDSKTIPVEDLEDVNNTHLSKYFFNPITNFHPDLISSLSALSELITINTFNSFVFNRGAVGYNGGKFQIATGNYQVKSIAELIVNCGVFVVGLLKSYDYDLIDWNTWPDAYPHTPKDSYLEHWFNKNNILLSQRQHYYNTAKEIRGKHVVVSPCTATKPSPYNEVDPLSDQLILSLNTNQPLP